MSRPTLTRSLPSAEFSRWYWTCVELRDFCGSEGLPTSGVKADLVARVVALLDGGPAPVITRRAPPPDPLPEPIGDTTVLPPGQRASRQLRTHLEHRIGPAFRVDRHMREFLLRQDGATVGDLVAHWDATRGAAPAPPDAQFEFNRFSIAWHAAHPGGSVSDCRAAWRLRRSLPEDRRPGPTD